MNLRANPLQNESERPTSNLSFRFPDLLFGPFSLLLDLHLPLLLLLLLLHLLLLLQHHLMKRVTMSTCHSPCAHSWHLSCRCTITIVSPSVRVVVPRYRDCPQHPLPSWWIIVLSVRVPTCAPTSGPVIHPSGRSSAGTSPSSITPSIPPADSPKVCFLLFLTSHEVSHFFIIAQVPFNAPYAVSRWNWTSMPQLQLDRWTGCRC